MTALLVGSALLATGCSGAAATSAPAVPSAQVALAAPSATPAPTVKATDDATPAPTATVAPTPAPTPMVSPDPNAKESHVTVDLVIVNTRYTPTELSAPANKTWHVKIDDQEVAANQPIGTLHNFTLSSGGQKLFQTATWGPGQRTFDIPGLPAGLYVFTCSIHPSAMRGTVDIK